MQTLEFELDRDYVELKQLLKLADLVTSGGEAKTVIGDGQVLVDGEVELRKACKIDPRGPAGAVRRHRHPRDRRQRRALTLCDDQRSSPAGEVGGDQLAERGHAVRQPQPGPAQKPRRQAVIGIQRGDRIGRLVERPRGQPVAALVRGQRGRRGDVAPLPRRPAHDRSPTTMWSAR